MAFTPDRELVEAARELLTVDSLPDKYIGDPVGFIDDAFDGVGSYEVLRQAIRSVLDHKLTFVMSVNATGKSYYLEAAGALWWTFSHGVNSTVYIIAPSSDQTEKLFTYIQQLIDNNRRKFSEDRTKIDIGGRVIGLNTVMRGRYTVMVGRNPPDNKARETLLGPHTTNGTLVLCEEASGLGKNTWEAAKYRLITGVNDRLLVCSNPTNPTSPAMVDWKKVNGKTRFEPTDFRPFHISAFDTPQWTGEKVPKGMLENLVSLDYVEQIRNDYGEGSPEWNNKVLGLPDFDQKQHIIYPQQVYEAYKFEFDPEDDIRPVLGVDLALSKGRNDYTVVYATWLAKVDDARTGDDATAGTRICAKSRFVWAVQDNSQLRQAHKIASIAAEMNAREIRYDAVGIGRPFFETLSNECAAQGLDVTIRAMMPQQTGKDLMNGETVRDALSGWYWEARQLFRDNAIDLDESEEHAQTLMDELTVRSYDEDDYNRVRIQSKRELTKSPDFADALVYSLQSDEYVEYSANPPKPKSTVQVRDEPMKQQMIEEYSNARGMDATPFSSRLHSMIGL